MQRARRTLSTVDIDVGYINASNPSTTAYLYPDDNGISMKCFKPTNLVDDETIAGRVGLVICAVPLHKTHGLGLVCARMNDAIVLARRRN